MNIAFNSFNQKRDKGFISNLPDQRNGEFEGEKSGTKKENSHSTRGILEGFLKKGSFRTKMSMKDRVESKLQGGEVKSKKKGSLLKRMMDQRRNKTFYEKTKNEEMRNQESQDQDMKL